MIDWNVAHEKGVRYWQIPDTVLTKALEIVPSGGRIIDIGCGSGELVSRIHALGYNAYGIDASDIAISIACSRGVGGIFRCVDIENGGISERYNLAFLNLVLPFLRDREPVLRQIKEMCNHLVLAVPVLLQNVVYSEKSRRVGMFQTELNDLVGAIFSKKEVLFQHSDESNREVVVYLLS